MATSSRPCSPDPSNDIQSFLWGACPTRMINLTVPGGFPMRRGGIPARRGSLPDTLTVPGHFAHAVQGDANRAAGTIRQLKHLRPVLREGKVAQANPVQVRIVAVRVSDFEFAAPKPGVPANAAQQFADWNHASDRGDPRRAGRPSSGSNQRNQASQPLRFSRRTNRAASAKLVDFMLGPSHSIRRPSPTRRAIQPRRMISVR